METVCLYRAVCLKEFEDISANGKFRSIPGSLEGKWFAETLHDAKVWGRLLFGTEPFRVVSATVPLQIATAFFRLDRLDNIGPARFGDSDQLGSAVIIQVLDV
jgi:hypothetical protein